MAQPFADGQVVRVWVGDDGILRLKWAPGVRITGDAARTAALEVNKLCVNTRRPMLVDMTETESVTREARTVFTEPGGANTIALLGRSPVDRVIANFVLGVSKLPTPTRYFNSEENALAWLREARNERTG